MRRKLGATPAERCKALAERFTVRARRYRGGLQPGELCKHGKLARCPRHCHEPTYKSRQLGFGFGEQE